MFKGQAITTHLVNFMKGKGPESKVPVGADFLGSTIFSCIYIVMAS